MNILWHSFFLISYFRIVIDYDLVVESCPGTICVAFQKYILKNDDYRLNMYVIF